MAPPSPSRNAASTIYRSSSKCGNPRRRCSRRGTASSSPPASAAALLLLVGIAVGLLLRQLRTQALIIEERARANREAEARGDIERARTDAETAMRDAQQSEARFRDIAEVGSDWIWETDAAHRFTMIAGARQPKVSLLGNTRWEQASVIEPETDPLWREHKAVLDAHQPFRQFRFSMQLPDGRFHVCVSGKPIFAEDGDFLGYRGTVSDETELIEKRERAARADALLHNAIDSIAEGFVIFDADDRFVMCNDAYRKMYPQNAAGFVAGARFEEIMRAAVATGRYPEAIGREDEWLAEHVRQHREGSALEEIQLADGRWVLHSERSMPDGGIAGLRIDVTALKAAQESLRESQAMLNRAQKLSATGSVVRNLQTKATEWSDEMYRIFGVERGFFQPRTDLFLAMIHPEDRARVEDLITYGAGNEAEPSVEFRIIRPDGATRWVYREADFWRDPDGKTSGMRLTTYKDVTENREADIRHRELETLLRDAIESISEGFVIYDKDDRLVICNEGYRRIYPEIADIIVPRIHFADLLRAQLARGHRPEMKGREEAWIAEMLRRRRLSAEPHEVKMHNDRWVLVFERRMSNGGLAGLRVDITELKAAQESLRESQAMLNRAQRLSATGSAVRNLKTGSLEWSDEMYRIFGLDRDNVTAGTTEFRSYIHPEDRDQVPSAREVARDGQTVAPVQFRIVRPDGTVRWLYREIELVRDGGEVTSVLSTYKDITEQREADMRQRHLEALLCDAIESISEGFVIYDADDRLVLCNEAFRKLYPMSADRMVPGTRYEDILRGAAYEHLSMQPENAEEWLAQRLRQHRELKEPVELQLQDGRWLFISERRTSSGGTAGLRVDITAMKRVQQSLRESQQRLDRTQQIAHIGTVERAVRSNVVVWSDETYRIFGVSPESYTPSFENLLGFVHPEDRERVLRVLRQHDSEHQHSSLTYRIIRPSGEPRLVFCQADTTFDEAGKPLYISIAMMDITEKEQASQRQLELETQLGHSEKLTALGTLAGGIAHDLNNTLVPIQALSKLVMQEFPENTPTRGDLETIYQASIQARDLVRQILAFSRKQDMLNEPTDIAARVQEALQMLRASVPSTIEIVERIAPIEPILADGTQLHQVIVNLVANSAHAIGDHCGRVTVTLDEVPGDAETTPRLVRLSIADTGGGMSPEIMHRMFEPFFTTKSVGEGTGLGLSVVHGIVTGHGGTIDVKSTPGQGTEFIILLPARLVDESSAIAAVA